MSKTKIFFLTILLLALPSIIFAKNSYHQFPKKLFKIKYDSKLWQKNNTNPYLRLKLKSQKTKIKLNIKKTNLNSTGKKNLKQQNIIAFANQFKDKIKLQFNQFHPMYQYSIAYDIAGTKYKAILMKFNLDPGALNVYYITNDTYAYQSIGICRKKDCTPYFQGFRDIIQSFRTLKDKTAPTFSGTMNAQSTSTSSITLSWPQASDNGSTSKNIRYLIYQANQMEEQNYSSPNYVTKKGATSYQINNLQESTSYYFVVRAKDEAGNIDSNQIQAIATTKSSSGSEPSAGSIQTVTYKSNGSTVVARMYRPNGSGPFPAIIYNHGGVTPLDPVSNDTRINQLRLGDTYAVLATAYRGDTNSEGNLSVSIGDVNDTLAAIEYLKSKSFIDSNKIGIFGESRGANVTLSTAERTNDLKAVASWYPYTDTDTYCDYIGQNYCTNTLGFNSDLAHYARISSPINFVSRLNTPVQNSHGTSDVVIPYSQSIELNSAMTGKSNYTFVEYPGADHGLSADWATTAIASRNQFFAQYLQ